MTDIEKAQKAWGERIRSTRVAQGVSQAELGSRVGVAQVHISRIEAGRGASVPTLIRIANQLSIPHDELFSEVAS